MTDPYMRTILISVALPDGRVAERSCTYYPPSAPRAGKVTISEGGRVLRTVKFPLPTIDEAPITELVCPLDGPLIGVTP